MNSKKLSNSFLIFVLAWIVLQVILVFVYINNSHGNDAIGYIRHALRVCGDGQLYPSKTELYDTYIQAPGYVNFYLAPIYALFHSIKAAYFVNIILNVIILFEIFYVAGKFFNKATAYISSVLYAIILSNLFAPTIISTEVPYLFFALSGFCLTLSKKSICWMMSGVMYAVAYTIKPLVLAFVVASIVYFIVNKYSYKSYVLMFLFAVLPLITLGIYNQRRVGYSVVSSSTGGYNLLMTANDKATPLPNHSLYYTETGIGYNIRVSKYTFAEKDKKWKDMAISWIKQHPFKYLALCVERVAVMYNKDTWSVPSLLGNLDKPDYVGKGKSRFILSQLIRMGYSLVYYVACVFFLFSLFKFHKQIFTLKGILLIILLLGIGGTCLFPMEHRYHYPYMFVIVIWAASYVSQLFKFNKIRNNNT